MSRVASQLHPVNHLGRQLAIDHLPTIRSIARFDMLGAALSTKRRGRRFLSQLTQAGFDIHSMDKLQMANALL